MDRPSDRTSSDIFRRTKKTEVQKNIFIQCACVPFGYTAKEIELVQAGAMTISTSLQIDIGDVDTHLAIARKHLQKHQGEKSMIRKISVPARSLNSLLIECNAPEEIDFLSLDVEGAELEVLRGLDFDRYRFKYILIESYNFKKTIYFLRKRQYKLLKVLGVSDLLFGLEGNKSFS